MWGAWLALWIVAAAFTKRTQWREDSWRRVLDAVPLLLCALLLLPAIRHLWPGALLLRFAPRSAALPLLGTVLVAVGLGFAAWARIHLGRNWSGRVSLKVGHVLIRSGPYAIARHPIYAGMLLALLGTALAVGEWRGLVAVLCAFVGFLRRIVVEERRMCETFPEYEAYRRATPALIPRLFCHRSESV